MTSAKAIFTSLSIFLTAVLAASSASAVFETPPLTIKTFQQLDFPPQLSKAEVQWTLQNTAQRLYGEAFVDLGAMSDFMHGHALFYPLDASMPVPSYRLTDKKAPVAWEQFGLRAVLFHTQEYDHLRPGREYRNSHGDLLDSLNRNWLFWSMDSEFGIKGDMHRAHLFHRNAPIKPPMTVSSGELRKDIFGEHQSDFEYSFYFFRVKDSDVAALGLSAEELAASNILQVSFADQSVYLVLVSFYCRNHPEDRDYCRGPVELKPYY